MIWRKFLNNTVFTEVCLLSFKFSRLLELSLAVVDNVSVLVVVLFSWLPFPAVECLKGGIVLANSNSVNLFLSVIKLMEFYNRINCDQAW